MKVNRILISMFCCSCVAVSASATIAKRTGGGLYRIDSVSCIIRDNGVTSQYTDKDMIAYFGVYQNESIRYDLIATLAGVEGQKLGNPTVTLSAYNVKDNKVLSAASTEGGASLGLKDPSTGVEVFCSYKMKRP